MYRLKIFLFLVALSSFFALTSSSAEAATLSCAAEGGTCKSSCSSSEIADSNSSCPAIRSRCCIPRAIPGNAQCASRGGTCKNPCNGDFYNHEYNLGSYYCSSVSLRCCVRNCPAGYSYVGLGIGCRAGCWTQQVVCSGGDNKSGTQCTTVVSACASVPGGGGGGGGGAPPPPPTPIPRYNISGTVFNDSNRNKVRDNGEGTFPGVRVSMTGRANSSTLTSSNGNDNYAISNLLAGAYALTVTVPGGWMNTSPLRQTTTIGPSKTNIDFGLVNTYSIGGDVFNDVNKNRIQDSTNGVPETNILSGITITSSGGSLFTNSGSGQYIINGLAAGAYTVRYTSAFPDGYFLIYPRTGPPPQFRLTVGPNCTRDVSLTYGASCFIGNINNADFAISNSIPWFQSYGLDVRLDDGFSDIIPASPIYPPYMSVADKLNTAAGRTVSQQTVNVNHNCSPPYPQLCSPLYTRAVNTSYVLRANFTASSGGCSSFRVHMFVNGVEKAVSNWLGWTGAPAPYNTLSRSTGTIDVGPLNAGSYTFGLQAEGQTGGCNTGQLGTWAGSLVLTTSTE